MHSRKPQYRTLDIIHYKRTVTRSVSRLLAVVVVCASGFFILVCQFLGLIFLHINMECCLRTYIVIHLLTLLPEIEGIDRAPLFEMDGKSSSSDSVKLSSSIRSLTIWLVA